MKILRIVLLSILISIVSAVTGVDVSQSLSLSTAQCLRSQGYLFVIVRGYCSYGSIDANAKQSITNGKSAGMITDAYHFPCMGGVSASNQVTDVVNYLGSSVGTYWIDVEYNPSTKCVWSSDHTKNCNFLSDLVSNFKAKGKLVGIYSNYYQWENIFGSASACANFSNLQLWYAHYDNTPSFSDFKSFGGWKSPNIKQYKGDTTSCGLGIDLDWYPGSKISHQQEEQ